MISVAAIIVETTPQETDQLYGNNVKGEDVRVVHDCCCGIRVLLPPSLVAHMEDEDEEREIEDVVDEEACKDVNVFSGHDVA